MPKFATPPPYRPTRSTWRNAFYYQQVDQLPAHSSSASYVASMQATNPSDQNIRMVPFGQDNWNAGSAAYYFVDSWPTGRTISRVTWSIIKPQLSTANPHLYFPDLRQQDAARNPPALQTLLGLPDYGVQLASGDRHAILWSEPTNELVEAIGYSGFSAAAEAIVTWNLNSYSLPRNGASPVGVIAACFPVAPLMFTYQDLLDCGSTGDLGHMLGVTAYDYGTTHVWPARDGDGTVVGGVPAGTVFRLKSNFNLNTLPNAALRAVGRTLQKYGFVIYDRNFTRHQILTPNDPAWPQGSADLGVQLGTLFPWSAFEAVNMTSVTGAVDSIEVAGSIPVIQGQNRDGDPANVRVTLNASARLSNGVIAANPRARFTTTPTTGMVPLTVTFDASSSVNADGGPVTSYNWDFGDGQTGTGRVVTHTYDTPGEYTPELTVTVSTGQQEGVRRIAWYDSELGAVSPNIVITDNGVTSTVTMPASAGDVVAGFDEYEVWEVVADDDYLYASMLGGHIASYNLSDGTWDARQSGGGLDILLADDSVWLVDSNGVLRRHDRLTLNQTAIYAFTTPVRLDPRAQTRSSAADGDTALWMGGFEQYQPSGSVSHLVRFDIASETFTTFVLPTDRLVRTVAVGGGYVFAGTDGSAAQSRIIRLDPTNGTTTTYSPNAASWGLIYAADRLYAWVGAGVSTVLKINPTTMTVEDSTVVEEAPAQSVRFSDWSHPGGDAPIQFLDHSYTYGNYGSGSITLDTLEVTRIVDPNDALLGLSVNGNDFLVHNQSGTATSASASSTETVTVGQFSVQPFATTRFTEAVRYSHRAITRAELITPSGERFMLPVVDGSMTIDRRNQVWRTADLTVGLDAVGTVERSGIDALNVVGSDLAIHAGIFYENDRIELVQIARLRVETFERRLSSASIQIAARDYASMLDEHPITPAFTNQLRNLSLAAAVGLLIEDSIPFTMPGMGTKLVVDDNIPGWFVPSDATFDGDGRLDTITRWCEAAGVYFLNLPNGAFNLRSKTTSDASVLTVSDGEGGVLVDANEAFSRLELYNAVNVTFDTPEGSSAPVRAFVVDDDPVSPTFWGGPFGRRVKEISDVPARTEAEAIAAATAKLNEAKGINRGLRITGIRYPTLVPGDSIDVELPGESSETHVIESVTHNLSGATVEIETRFVS